MLKYHVTILYLIFERCRQLQFSLNLNKCIFYKPFGTLLGHMVCKDGALVDPTKIAAITNLEAPTNVHTLRLIPGHTGYYKRFIKGYTAITTLMEWLLNQLE